MGFFLDEVCDALNTSFREWSIHNQENAPAQVFTQAPDTRQSNVWDLAFVNLASVLSE